MQLEINKRNENIITKCLNKLYLLIDKLKQLETAMPQDAQRVSDSCQSDADRVKCFFNISTHDILEAASYYQNSTYLTGKNFDRELANKFVLELSAYTHNDNRIREAICLLGHDSDDSGIKKLAGYAYRGLCAECSPTAGSINISEDKLKEIFKTDDLIKAGMKVALLLRPALQNIINGGAIQGQDRYEENQDGFITSEAIPERANVMLELSCLRLPSQTALNSSLVEGSIAVYEGSTSRMLQQISSHRFVESMRFFSQKRSVEVVYESPDAGVVVGPPLKRS